MGEQLESRGVPAGDGRLRSDAIGEVEEEDGLLIVKRLHLTHHLRVDADADRDAIEQAHEYHVSRCDLAQTVIGCIDITTDLKLEEEA